MTHGPQDPRWPKLLSLSVHEFRTPMTVVAGYIRMLLKDRAGPVTDQQRRLLEEAEKSCARLSALLSEMSDLGNLEAGTATFNRNGSVSIAPLLTDTIAGLPGVPDREVTVRLEAGDETFQVQGDPVRLKAAFGSLLQGLRREVVTSTELFVRVSERDVDGQRSVWVAIGDADHVSACAEADASALAPFDEWRGGMGLSLPVARRIINAHGGTIYGPADGGRASAAVALPRAS